MRTSVKIMASVCVLGLGAGGGWQFRKTPQPQPSPDRSSLARLVLRERQTDASVQSKAAPVRRSDTSPLAILAAIDDADHAIRMPSMPIPFSPSAENSRWTVHKVRDGDTLESIANLFLGDPRLSTYILQANREAISNPNILPIGTPLKIPRTVPKLRRERAASGLIGRKVGLSTASKLQPSTSGSSPTLLDDSGWRKARGRKDRRR